MRARFSWSTVCLRHLGTVLNYFFTDKGTGILTYGGFSTPIYLYKTKKIGILTMLVLWIATLKWIHLLIQGTSILFTADDVAPLFMTAIMAVPSGKTGHCFKWPGVDIKQRYETAFRESQRVVIRKEMKIKELQLITDCSHTIFTYFLWHIVCVAQSCTIIVGSNSS